VRLETIEVPVSESDRSRCGREAADGVEESGFPGAVGTMSATMLPSATSKLTSSTATTPP
jgi:hypothetical protein